MLWEEEIRSVKRNILPYIQFSHDVHFIPWDLHFPHADPVHYPLHFPPFPA